MTERLFSAFFSRMAHTNGCNEVAWNHHGNWFLTSSRDCTVKLFDVRSMKKAVRTFRGNNIEGVTRVAWHPTNKEVFASATVWGTIRFYSAQ